MNKVNKHIAADVGTVHSVSNIMKRKIKELIFLENPPTGQVLCLVGQFRYPMTALGGMGFISVFHVAH